MKYKYFLFILPLLFLSNSAFAYDSYNYVTGIPVNNRCYNIQNSSNPDYNGNYSLIGQIQDEFSSNFVWSNGIKHIVANSNDSLQQFSVYNSGVNMSNGYYWTYCNDWNGFSCSNYTYNSSSTWMWQTIPELLHSDIDVNYCVAPVVVNGVCGSNFDCSTGSFSYVDNDNWECSGLNGGTTASCYSAPSCGSSSNSCLHGSLTDFWTSQGVYPVINYWTCSVGSQNINCNDDQGSHSTTTLPIYPEPEYLECGITSGELILGCIKNAFIWSITAPQSDYDKFTVLLDTLKKKPPIGYVMSTINVFNFSTSTNTFILVSENNILHNLIFIPLRQILVIIIYIFGAIWLFRRVKDIII